MTTLEEQEIRVQWPYKYLWNVLRGESIVADDEVIHEELRTSYERIILALTQFPYFEGDATNNETTAKDSSTSNATAADANPAADATETSSSAGKNEEKSFTENEKKLRKRIAAHLELEESTAWDIFCGYMMFEYRGGSTSFEKLLNAPRVSTDFLTELKQYYHHERVSVLLVIQTIFGHASQADHKYNHIFQAVCDWLKQDGAVALTQNLVKSLSMTKDAQEEIHILHALTLFIYHMPTRGINDFCTNFTSFKPGRKDKSVLQAEAVLMFTVMNFPLLQEAEEEVPESLQQSVEKFLENGADDLLINDFSMGAVLSGYFLTSFQNQKVKQMLAHPKHRFHETFSSMLQLAHSYSSDSVENNRNNLSNIVLKGILFALRAISEGFTENKIFRCGSRDEVYELAGVLMDHSEVAALLCSDEGSVLQSTVSTAMTDFPLHLKHITNIWGSLCAANARFPNQCIPLLKDCCKMVTTLAENVEDPATVKQSLQMNGYKLIEHRVVAGVKLPPGTELDQIEEDPAKGTFTLYWRIPNNLVVDVFSVINNQLLIPIASQLRNVALGSTPVEQLVSWVQDPEENVWSVLKFLIKYASFAPAITEALRLQYEPMAFIVFKTMDFITPWKLKSELCSHLIELLVGANKFGTQSWTDVYFSEVWPTRAESNAFISEIIMGYESVANNDCCVTIAFLKSILSFFKGDGSTVQFKSDLEEKLAYNSVDFVNENVFHSFTRWRFSSVESKYKILLNTLKVYGSVFDVKLESWSQLKADCAGSLLASNSSLMTVLSANENEMQLSVIQPTNDNCLIPEIIYQSLSVLLKLFQFQNESIKLVDASLGSTLVQKLGRFARHRLDYKIPTLAMSLLKKIAEEMHMSLLSCFGSEEISFRDLILQRLEFRSEDVNLKVSILDFLTVAAHTQPGLIQYVFMDDFLAQKIVDLPTEKDEGLALAVLCFLRVLFRKGAIVMKKCQNLWENVFYPINQLQPSGRIKIITCTLNIASLELFRFGLVNAKFATELKVLLKVDNFVKFFEMPFSQRGEQSVKCLLAFKHFISVVLHRNDLEDEFDEKMRAQLLEIVSDRYWVNKDEDVEDPHISKVMVELMCQLLTSITDEDYFGQYLEGLSGLLSKHFFESTVPVQIGTLMLVNTCMKKASKRWLSANVLEHIYRVVARIFDNAAKIFKHAEENLANIGPLITLSATIVITTIKTVDVNEWQPLFHRYMIPHAIVHATHLGVQKCKKEEIIMELLYVMLKMSEVKECAEALISGQIVQKVFIFVLRNEERSLKEIEWSRIYLVTLQLLTQMLRTEKIYFVEDTLNLWGSHGTYIISKLNSLPVMSTECKINQPEYNFKVMKNLLTFTVYALDAINAMVPFWKHWSLNSHFENLRVMDAVFTVMQTAVNLLDQPQYLQSFISQSQIHGSGGKAAAAYSETRPTSQLLELNSKLWHVIHISTTIYWSLRTWTNDFPHNSKMLTTSNQIAQTSVKALSKPERKSHSSGGGGGVGNTSHSHSNHLTIGITSTDQITDTLERALSIYLFHGKMAMEDPRLASKQKHQLSREIGTDASTLVDGVRRITTNDLLNQLCQALETTFN